MTTEATSLDEVLARFPKADAPPRTSTRRETVRGQMTIHYEPDLHVHFGCDGEQDQRLRLHGDALERALRFDGEFAMGTIVVTMLDGVEVDRIVGIVNPGNPLTGRELVSAVRAITAEMTEEEREEFSESLSPGWRER